MEPPLPITGREDADDDLGRRSPVHVSSVSAARGSDVILNPDGIWGGVVRRWMIASVLAIVTGVVAALLAGSILEPTGTVIGFWGAVCGIAAALVALVATWTLPGRQLRMRLAWRIVVAVALGLLAIAAAWWVTMWGVPPWTLEGAWMYAILLLAGAGSLALSLTLRRGR